MKLNRVLIIDDDIRICNLFRRVTDELGLLSYVINEPSSPVIKELEFNPDIVLLDLQIPKLDGIKLLRDIAQYHADAAVVIISGMERDILEAATKVGASLGLTIAGSLTKPVNLNSLRQLLNKSYRRAESKPINSREITRSELVNSVPNDEIVVFYQPQIDLKENRIIGVEALVRWQHPVHGLVMPDEFIPLAEKEEALIEPITFRVLDTILKSDAMFRNKGFSLNYSLNLSAMMLDDLNLPDRIVDKAAAAKFDAARLMIEVTESALIPDTSNTLAILTRLRLNGFRLSIDDYGTGFSSLDQLYRIPFTEVKVDKSFVMEAMASDDASAIVENTIDLGHRLGMQVVAEGIEDQKTADWLKARKCDIGQGYFYGKPSEHSRF